MEPGKVQGISTLGSKAQQPEQGGSSIMESENSNSNNNEENNVKTKYACDQLLNIFNEKFVRHFKHVDHLSLRRVVCSQPEKVLQAVVKSGLKIQSLDISGFVQFPSRFPPFFDLDLMLALHCSGGENQQ